MNCSGGHKFRLPLLVALVCTLAIPCVVECQKASNGKCATSGGGHPKSATLTRRPIGGASCVACLRRETRNPGFWDNFSSKRTSVGSSIASLASLFKRQLSPLDYLHEIVLDKVGIITLVNPEDGE